MALLNSAGAKLSQNPKLLRIPPFLSAICVIVGIVWLLLLPLDEYSRQNYVSENALLPGQVHTYFGGSEQNVFRAFKHELEALKDGDYALVAEKLQTIFKSSGLKVATQDYTYEAAGIEYRGKNVYSILQAPRGDGTEAIVLVAPWKNVDGELNINGVGVALTLARYFNRWSFWSKDVIFLITPDTFTGTQAWITAYHDEHAPSVSPLPLKSGALQGALVVDYPFDHRFSNIHISYDGINGQLPNLDLINIAVQIAGGQMGIGTNLQRIYENKGDYQTRLQTMLRGMVEQGLGHPSGAHSSFMPYHIDAITIQACGDGWQDEMALGRTIEGIFRSLNNLLEHLHQSFFFYLLMQPNRFVSIGTYLPSAMLIAGGFTIMAIAGWVRSGWKLEGDETPSEKKKQGNADEKKSLLDSANETASDEQESENAIQTVERNLTLPLLVVPGAYALGTIPLCIFTHVSHQHLLPTFALFTALNTLLPVPLSYILTLYTAKTTPPTQSLTLIKSFTLLLLGLFLSALATVNFSLSFLIGLFCVPLSFIGHISSTSISNAAVRKSIAAFALLVLTLLSPPFVFAAACVAVSAGVGVGSGVEGASVIDGAVEVMALVLREASFGWHVNGVWTLVVVWCVWWPAWLVGAVLSASTLWG